MCAIAGFYNTSKVYYDKIKIIENMTNSMLHRGPDSSGYYHSKFLSLGHRRLSIIDKKNRSSQPMYDSSKRYVIVYNGEIYNYRDLKCKLKEYQFTTESDTEVVLASFIKWGEKCLNFFRGQYAIAIWDSKIEKLFIARDRIGEKPLYYYNSENGIFLFASEIRALLKTGIINSEISQCGLIDYLKNGSVSSPNTLLKDVYQLPAGHFAWIDKNRVEIKEYWNIYDSSLKSSEKNNNLKDLILNIIEEQMVCDVPMGAFLSGGIDSSMIVALMAEYSNEKINTLSVVFDESEFNEEQYSSIIAKRYNTSHTRIKFTSLMLNSQLEEYFNHLDVPSGDGVNTYIVSNFAKKEGLKVVLSGVGGDEIFAGYRAFRLFRFFMRYSFLWNISHAIKREMFFLRFMPGGFNKKKYNEFLNLKPRDASGFYALMRRSGVVDELFLDEILNFKYSSVSLTLRQNVGKCSLKSFPYMSQFSIMEILNYLQNVLLKDTDNMGMANSLEIRAPFCDYRLIEQVLLIPDKLKYHHYPKQLLIDAFPKALPSEVVNRKKKGFSFPWNLWLKKELKELCEETLASLLGRSIFSKTAIEELWSSYINTSNYDNDWNFLWRLVVLEKWIQKNM